jgi:MFS family permease
MRSSTEKRNVFLLASAQALFQTASVFVMTASGLVGQQMADDKALATLPIAMISLAIAVMLIPASLFMQRFGRRAGFMVGTTLGALAGIVSALGIWADNFALFVFGNMFIGAYQAFAQYYRFAAADIASEEFKSRAISWVIAGGIVAAIAGPSIARFTSHIGPYPFAVSFIVLFMLGTIAFFIVRKLEVPPPSILEVHGPSRPLTTIMKQPIFLTALVGSVGGYAVMLMVMTATPLAMTACGHSVGAASSVIQWHVLGMFVPSFFTGNLIRRFGVLPIMAAGLLLIAAHVAIALAGTMYVHFVVGLTVVGIGWNFLFIGGTTLLTEAYTPREKAKTQAAHDFLMFGVITLATFAAGGLLDAYGWRVVNLMVVPFVLVALVALTLFGIYRKNQLRITSSRST